MPEINSTGLHTPITNILSTETVTKKFISEGSIGSGEELAIPEGQFFESVPRVVLETFAAGDFTRTIPDVSGLHDVGTASFGAPPMLEAIIGTDERVQVKDTTLYPWRAIASLIITGADGSQWIGTGWFIAPRTLITAGHCVYIKHSGIPSRDGWVKKIQVIPGRNGNEAPFGALTATEFWTVKGWGDAGEEFYDYGAIILPSAFPQELGTFGFQSLENGELEGVVANVAGYPGDKPSGTLWYDFREVSALKPDKVYYAADTYGGQSGVVVYHIDKDNRKRYGIGIHAYGGTTANSATRISAQVFLNMKSWERK